MPKQKTEKPSDDFPALTRLLEEIRQFRTYEQLSPRRPPPLQSPQSIHPAPSADLEIGKRQNKPQSPGLTPQTIRRQTKPAPSSIVRPPSAIPRRRP